MYIIVIIIPILPQHILIPAHKLTYSYKLTILIQTNSYTYQLQLGVNESNRNTTTRTLRIFSPLSSVLCQKRMKRSWLIEPSVFKLHGTGVARWFALRTALSERNTCFDNSQTVCVGNVFVVGNTR